MFNFRTHPYCSTLFSHFEANVSEVILHFRSGEARCQPLSRAPKCEWNNNNLSSSNEAFSSSSEDYWYNNFWYNTRFSSSEDGGGQYYQRNDYQEAKPQPFFEEAAYSPRKNYNFYYGLKPLLPARPEQLLSATWDPWKKENIFKKSHQKIRKFPSRPCGLSNKAFWAIVLQILVDGSGTWFFPNALRARIVSLALQHCKCVSKVSLTPYTIRAVFIQKILRYLPINCIKAVCF